MAKTEEKEMLNINPMMLQELPFIITGFSESRTPQYVVYIALLYTFYSYLYVMSIYNITNLSHDIVYLIAAVHFITAIQWVMVSVPLRIIMNKNISEGVEMIKNGIYSYENDGIDDEQRKIKKEVADDWTRGTIVYVAIYAVAYTCVMFVSPILGYLLIPEDSKFYSDPVVNPYMPHIFYTPFDPNTTSGFVLTYIVDLVFWSVGCSTTYSTIRLFLFIMVNLKLHLKVLKYSVDTIQQRALRAYGKKFRIRPENLSLEELFSMKEFNRCLHSCLRDNIRHHQTLLRYKNIFEPYSGPNVLAVNSVVVVMIYAALLYLIFQPIPLNMRLRFFCMLFSEEVPTLILCLFGEDIILESGKIFDGLYETPWIHYDKEFKQTMHIMMTHTRVPFRFKALFQDASASRESYGEIVKATYSLMNLLSAF